MEDKNMTEEEIRRDERRKVIMELIELRDCGHKSLSAAITILDPSLSWEHRKKIG